MDDNTNFLDAYNDKTFELFWAEVEEYAKHMDLPLHYVEEEFIIDGDLVKVNLLD